MLERSAFVALDAHRTRPVKILIRKVGLSNCGCRTYIIPGMVVALITPCSLPRAVDLRFRPLRPQAPLLSVNTQRHATMTMSDEAAAIEQCIRKRQGEFGISYETYHTMTDADGGIIDGMYFFFSTPNGERAKIRLSGKDLVENSERPSGFLRGKIKAALKAVRMS